jgi:hypothetical protein
VQGAAGRGPAEHAVALRHPQLVPVPQVAAPCDQPHDTEYVGAFTATLPLPADDDAAYDYAEQRCRDAVNAYVGSSNNVGITPAWPGHPREGQAVHRQRERDRSTQPRHR